MVTKKEMGGLVGAGNQGADHHARELGKDVAVIDPRRVVEAAVGTEQLLWLSHLGMAAA